MTISRQFRIHRLAALGGAFLAGTLLACAARGADADNKPVAAGDGSYDSQVTAGLNYLRTKGQAADGSYSAQAGPAITAVVMLGVLRNGRSPDEPFVAKALKYLEGFVHDDGGIYGPGHHQNYETCVALECFKAANADHRYDKLVKNADDYLRSLQWDATKGVDPSNVKYGGAGYGGENSRPDLSNTSFLVDALKASGAGGDDEAIKKALVFVSRCQNLETEHNTTKFAAKNPDGGFYYTAAGDGSSPAGNTADGGLRSYGSMTYAGLKSMIYAGVGPDDPRVKAAFKWVQSHYDVETNPGMGAAGLYYYYQAFAKALAAMGKDEIEDNDGARHAWRSDLVQALAKRQKPDGSWVNENGRWLEGDTNLVTGYALLTLSYCKPAK
jgi:squalene-hopene/tetraprenyl-beta-curcumene cyclase